MYTYIYIYRCSSFFGSVAQSALPIKVCYYSQKLYEYKYLSSTCTNTISINISANSIDMKYCYYDHC